MHNTTNLGIVPNLANVLYKVYTTYNLEKVNYNGILNVKLVISIGPFR